MRTEGDGNNGGRNDDDDDMYGDDAPMTMDESSAPPAVRQASVAPPHHPAGSTSEARNLPEGTPAPAPQPKPKRSMKITHDKYLQLQGLIIMHLTAHENTTGKGMDKDELIDWYLESKEEEFENVDEMEYERELITKMLRKLVKVSHPSISLRRLDTDSLPQDNYLIEVRGDVQESLPSEATTQSSATAAEGENVRTYYMVHPSVDTEESSMPSGF